MKILKNKKGQSLVEYILITAVVAIGALAVLRIMGHTVAVKFTQVTNEIQGGTHAKIKPEEITPDKYQKVDMSNFMRESN